MTAIRAGVARSCLLPQQFADFFNFLHRMTTAASGHG
jgi:hypothetical protein